MLIEFIGVELSARSRESALQGGQSRWLEGLLSRRLLNSTRLPQSSPHFPVIRSQIPANDASWDFRVGFSLTFLPPVF